MKTSDSTCLGKGCSGHYILSRSEGTDLRKLIELVGRVFHVPIAYAAMLGHRDRVMTRLGSGESWWRYLRTFSLGEALAAPVVIRDSLDGLPRGTDLGGLRFAATAPLRTLCGQHLGVLVIADEPPRPGFSEADQGTLMQLADIVAGRIELGMIAFQLMDRELQCEEAENRFRTITNGTTDLVACSEANGSCEFVNEAWKKFSGREATSELGDGWQEIMHPSFRQPVLTKYWQALQMPRLFTFELPLRRWDGVFRWTRGHCTPRFLADGTFAGFLVNLTDLWDYVEPLEEQPLDQLPGQASDATMLPHTGVTTQ